MAQGGYQVIIIFPIKSRMAAAKSSAFCDFSTELNLHLRHSKSAVYN